MTSVGFIGAGAVGSTLARALHAAGISVVAIAAKRRERARSLAHEIPGCAAFDRVQDVVHQAELIFLAVPDDDIQTVCSELTWIPGKAVVHCSGAHTVEVLSTAAASGAMVGACHPMQAFAGSGDIASHLQGCMFGIEAEEPLRSTITGMVESIGGWPLILQSEDKVTYHLAGVLASNYFVALTAAATSLLEELGLDRADALRGLLPILYGTVGNLESRGLPMALTGPISRGDVGTIELHLQTLSVRHPQLLSLYVELGRRTIPVARERGGLSAESEQSLDSLFDAYSSVDRQ